MTALLLVTKNKEPTTCKCMHLVTLGHFWSHDKDGGHAIWSVVAKNLMLYANIMAYRVIADQSMQE